MLGRLPWLALERRIRAFFFLVFFDMNSQASGAADGFPHPRRARRQSCRVIDRPLTADGTMTIQRSFGPGAHG